MIHIQQFGETTWNPEECVNENQDLTKFSEPTDTSSQIQSLGHLDSYHSYFLLDLMAHPWNSSSYC